MSVNSVDMDVTLDSWAVLALLQGERAGLLIKELIAWCSGDETAVEFLQSYFTITSGPPRLFINLINIGEIFYIVGRRKGIPEARKIVAKLKSFPLEIVPASEELVIEASTLKSKYPIAYADAFALATAMSKKSILLTGDPEFKNLPQEMPVFWLSNEERK